MSDKNQTWKSEELSGKFLKNIRGAIPLADKQIEVMVSLIASARPELVNYLDIGCGDGILGRSIHARFNGATGLFIDFSEPMVKAARKAIGDLNAKVLLGDFTTPDWQSLVETHEPFDAIVSGYSIHHLTDTRKAELCGEIFGLLKPGGMFINVEHVSSPTQWLTDRFEDIFVDSLCEYAKTLGEEITREQAQENFYARRHDKAANILAPVEDQLDWLRDIGYQNVDCYLKIFELALFGGTKPDG